jgi:(R,R)-butanediol dehydrogenase/meso-butanediol dehydrogenase/diacetyl reductase
MGVSKDFECAGIPGSLDLAISAVRRRGTVAAPGFCWTPDPFASIWAMIKEATIRYTNVYDTREFEIAVRAARQWPRRAARDDHRRGEP